MLDRALAELGTDRAQLYLTNAVKHFKFTRSGKVRIHAKASIAEQRACKPWLEAELAAIDPVMVVCLGGTAARAVLGAGFELMRERGRVLPLGDGVRYWPRCILRGCCGSRTRPLLIAVL